MLLSIKKLSRLVIFKIIDLLIFPDRNVRKGTILLIRLDAIGDYILFRNFIKVLRESGKYKGYKITLVGNVVWRNLSENLDKECIDEFIWVDKNKFNDILCYRHKKLKELSKYAYEVIINPVFSREFMFSDWIVNMVYAEDKIGSKGDLSNSKGWQKYIGDSFYTRLLPASDFFLFEFTRNREFFEILLSEKIQIKRTFIDLKKITLNTLLPEKFVVLFLGSSTEYSKWPSNKFAKVAEYLNKKYLLDIVLCGGPGDVDIAKKVKKNFKRCLDLVGKTSLVELAAIIGRAKLIVSNETSAPHLAIATDTKCVVIYNGNHFGRFTPYPIEISDKYDVVYHPKIKHNIQEYEILSNSYGYSSNLNINDIEVEDVKSSIDKFLVETF